MLHCFPPARRIKRKIPARVAAERGCRERQIAIMTSLRPRTQDDEAIWCHVLASRASRSATYFFNSIVSRSATTTCVGPQKDGMEVALRSSSFSMFPHMDHVHNETIPARNLAPPPVCHKIKHCY